VARWGILAVAVIVALLLSMVAGYLFSGMMAARMAGLEYYRAGGEAVAARTEAITATATVAPAAGKEGQGAAGAQEAVTAYAGRGRMISYTASMSLLVPRGGVKRCVDAILSLVSSYGGYISSLSFSFNPGTVYVPAGGYATSTMTITADKTAPSRPYKHCQDNWGGCEQWDKQLHNDHRERDQVEAAQEECEELQTMLEHSF